MAVQSTGPLDRTFHALGDPTRRGMLSILAKHGECTASELGEPFDIAQPTASRHLKVLEDAGLVSREVRGRIHQFRLELGPMSEAEDWIARHREFWMASMESLDKYLKQLGRKKGRKL